MPIMWTEACGVVEWSDILELCKIHCPIPNSPALGNCYPTSVLTLAFINWFTQPAVSFWGNTENATNIIFDKIPPSHHGGWEFWLWLSSLWRSSIIFIVNSNSTLVWFHDDDHHWDGSSEINQISRLTSEVIIHGHFFWHQLRNLPRFPPKGYR